MLAEDRDIAGTTHLGACRAAARAAASADKRELTGLAAVAAVVPQVDQALSSYGTQLRARGLC